MDILSPINTAIWNSHFLDANAVEFESNHFTQIHSCRFHYSRIVRCSRLFSARSLKPTSAKGLRLVGTRPKNARDFKTVASRQPIVKPDLRFL